MVKRREVGVHWQGGPHALFSVLCLAIIIIIYYYSGQQDFSVL